MKSAKRWLYIMICLLLSSVVLAALGCGGPKSGGELPYNGKEEELILTDSPMDVIDPAMEAFGWVELGTMSYDFGDERIEDGNYYYLVDNEYFSTMEEMRAYLSTLFSDELVEDLIFRGSYREFDGKLYGMAAARGSDIYIAEVTYARTEMTDEREVYEATVCYYDEDLVNIDESLTKTLDFVRELVSEERMVFTQFPYFY